MLGTCAPGPRMFPPQRSESLRRYFSAWPEVELACRWTPEWVMRFNAHSRGAAAAAADRRGAARPGSARGHRQHHPSRDPGRRAEIEVTKLVGVIQPPTCAGRSLVHRRALWSRRRAARRGGSSRSPSRCSGTRWRRSPGSTAAATCCAARRAMTFPVFCFRRRGRARMAGRVDLAQRRGTCAASSSRA